MAVLMKEKIETPDGNIELLWATPEGVGPFPAILFVHGHMENRAGASIHKNFLDSQDRLNRWGVCLASVSQPGYGGSSGMPDYCGPRTQAAIIKAVDFLETRSMIDPRRIAIIGYSRGAIVAAMVATQLQGLKAIVLGAGFYDFNSYFEHAPKGIQDAIQKEVNINDAAFEARSAIKSVGNIKVPVLIFHGNLDERGGAREAEVFAESIRSNNVRAELRDYKQFGHHIPFRIFLKETTKFLSEELSGE